MNETLWVLLGGDLFVTGLAITALALVVSALTWPIRAYRRHQARKDAR